MIRKDKVFVNGKKNQEIQDKRLLTLEKMLEKYEPIDIYEYHKGTTTEIEIEEEGSLLRLYVYIERKEDCESRNYFDIYDIEYWDSDSNLLDLTEAEKLLFKRYLNEKI